MRRKKLITRTPTLEEPAGKQAIDNQCRAVILNEGQFGSKFHVDQRGFLLRKFLADGVIKSVAPTSLQAHILNPAHHPSIAKHSEQQWVHFELRGTNCWPHKDTAAYTTLVKYERCAGKKIYTFSSNHSNSFGIWTL